MKFVRVVLALMFPLCACSAAAQELETIPVDPSLLVAAEPPVTLAPVVVTGTRTEHALADSPVEVQLISAQEIRRSGARDLAELLEREGGVYASRAAGRGSSIEIQGLSSEHVLILVDGRRMIGRINGAIDLTRLRVDMIERVEIVKGPSSALYGADALGGVINVITRSGGHEQGGALTLRGDEDGNADVYGNAGWTLGALRGNSSGGYSRLQAYDLDDATVGEDGLDGRSRYAESNADWKLSEGFTLGASGAYSIDDTQRIDGGSSNASFDTRKRIEEVRAGIAPRIRLGDDTELKLDAYYNRYFDQFLQRNRSSGEYPIDEETLDQLYAGGGQLDHRIGVHRLSVGGEYQFERLEADRLGEAGERDRQSAYAQDEFSYGAFTFVPGLRYDRDSQFGDQVSPKLALRWDVADGVVLRAGYGRGYRAPDFKQLLLRFDNPAVGYRVEGNPDLDAESSTGFNLGATWYASDTASYSVGAYHNRVKDLIELEQVEVGPPVIYSYRNVASATLTGFDAQAQLRPWSPLELRFGYGWLRSRDEDTGEELSGRPEHRVNASMRYEQALYALQLRGVWIAERTFALDLDTGGQPLEAGEADAYALFDARAELTPWKAWTFALGLENLFDEGDPRYLPIQPRTAYLELGWTFR